MSCPTPDILIKRFKPFKPSKLKVALLSVSDFTMHNPRQIAEQAIQTEEYKSFLRKTELNRLNDIPGDNPKTRPVRAKAQVEEWLADLETRENMIVEMTERISKIKTPANLPSAVEDIRKMYLFVTLTLGISVDDITVMAMPADRDKIIHQVPDNFDAQEKGIPFYPGPESKEKFESK